MIRTKIKEFSVEIAGLFDGEYKVLDEKAVNGRMQFLVRHTPCGGETWISRPGMLAKRKHNNIGCNLCYQSKRSKSIEEFKDDVFELRGSIYKVLGDYINNKVPIKMLHNITECMSVFEIRPDRFLNGTGCPKCFGHMRDNVAKFNDLAKGEYLLESEVSLCNSKVSLRHIECGGTYKASLTEFFRGKRCPFCVASKGERKIRDFLGNQGEIYKEQYRMAGCKSKRILPFDFAIFKDDCLEMLIEYDGKQHFVDGCFGNNCSLEDIQKRDEIKDSFCKVNNIRLLRIPYTEFDNIESIMEAALYGV